MAESYNKNQVNEVAYGYVQGNPQYGTCTTRCFSKRQRGYKTPKGSPRHPLPYDMCVSQSNAGWNKPYDCENTTAAYLTQSWGGGGLSMDELRVKAYQKLVDKLQQNTQLAVNFAERHEALDMLASTLRGLRTPVKTFASSFKAHLKRVKTGQESVLRRPIREFTQGWLAFHFGMEPLMKDIYATCEILSAPPHPAPVKLKSSSRFDGPVAGGKIAPYEKSWSGNISKGVSMGATFEVDNSRLVKLNQLGLLNPASVAWELVPYSFVVDWFYPVGALIGSLTDFVGYKVTDGYTTYYMRADSSDIRWGAQGVIEKDELGSALHVRRDVGVPCPGIPRPHLPKSFSPVRALTALSLVVQHLKSIQVR